VLYHGGGLTLADVKARSVNSLQRVGFGALAGEPGQVQAAAGNFGIPSTGYVTDVFRPGHPALDIARPFNVPENQAPIVAAYPGRVVWAGDAWSGPYGGYGNLVVIDHGIVGGVHVATYYAHWRTRYVNVGDFVWTGWRLADQSDYGWTTGVNLHFEVREGGTLAAWRPYFDGTPVDPTAPRYLNRPLRAGDYVVAATPTALFRVLMPLAGR
jgi:murein DD-endopeptidase MepM/ murein hydrolase activator NlpD